MGILSDGRIATVDSSFIRIVDRISDQVTTYAGTLDNVGYGGVLNNPYSFAADSSFNTYYIADKNNKRIVVANNS